MELTVKIELSDIKEYLDLVAYENGVGSIDEITEQDLTEEIMCRVIDKVSQNISSSTYFKEQVKFACLTEIMKSKNYMTAEIIRQAKEDILKQRTMLEVRPKKKEFQELDKEWESYFTELIEKCIKRKLGA